MAWPDIFFPKKRPVTSDAPATGAPAQPPDVPKIVDPPAEATSPLSSPPVPTPPELPEPSAASAEPAAASVVPVPKPPSQALPPPRFPAPPAPGERATRTLPVVHGVILRPPARTTGQLPAPPVPQEPMKNIEQLMTEADPVKTLSQTGSVRMLKRLSPDAPPVRTAATPPPIRAETAETVDAPAPPEPTPAPAAADIPAPVLPAQAPTPPVILPPKATEAASPWPSFHSKSAAPTSDARQTDPLPPLTIRKPEVVRRPGEPIKVDNVATSLRSSQLKSVGRESTFLLRPTVAASPAAPASPANRIPPPLPPMIQLGSIVRRKAKLADVARIVLPPKREETGPLPSAQAATVPRPTPKPLPRVNLQQMLSNTGHESPFLERSAVKTGPLPSAPVTVSPAQTTVLSPLVAREQTAPQNLTATVPLHPPALVTPEPIPEPVPAHEKTVRIPELQPSVDLEPIPPVIQAKAPGPSPTAPAIVASPGPSPALVETKLPELKPALAAPAVAIALESFLAPVEAKSEPVVLPPLAPRVDFAAPTLDSSLVFDPKTMPVIPEAPPLPPIPVESVTATSPPAFEPVPQVDAEAHKTAPQSSPQLDPEAHKVPPPVVAAEASASSAELGPVAPGTREFHLTNGERVAGVVLSETPHAIYVQHPSLGVLTVPRDEIATRLAEIILINGDRIVGNIMAETSDTLYVRHASLGMLTVPKAQRSTRVVEAILKNGDRVLGEVLTETDTFTVIKSATLGTVTVPHTTVSMLNRKIEQIEMKTLPSPQLMDKK